MCPTCGAHSMHNPNARAHSSSKLHPDFATTVGHVPMRVDFHFLAVLQSRQLSGGGDKMNKRMLLLAALIVGGILLAACGPAATPAQPSAPVSLKMGYSVWVGYGPLFIAKEKGYFKDENLDVTLTKVEDPKDRFTALNGKQFDGLVSTLDTMTLYWKAETPFVAINGLDDSSGGDGIVVL